MYSITQYENSKNRELIDCSCDRCGKEFKRQRLQIYVNIKRGQTSLFCSQKCFQPIGKEKLTKTCQECGKDFIGKGSKFCTRSCGATHNNRRRSTKVIFKCAQCGKEKLVTKDWLKSKTDGTEKCYLCSKPQKIIKEYDCGMCNKKFTSNDIRKTKPSKCGKRFCGKSCRMSYYNKFHKIAKVKNKSRPEELFVALIAKEFPDLKIVRNDRETLKSGLELDINMPEIKLALEINGPVHYMPIYGEERLNIVVAKDSQKFAETHALGISLLVIDVSTWQSKKSQEEKSLKVFNETVKPLIEEKLKKLVAGNFGV